MQSNTPKNIRDLIEAFAADLAEAIAQNIGDALGLRLGASAPEVINQLPKVKTVHVSTSGRRTSTQIEALKTEVLQHVRAHANGSRVEEISVGMGVSTKDLKLPIIALLDERKLTKKGERRGTRYFVPKAR